MALTGRRHAGRHALARHDLSRPVRLKRTVAAAFCGARYDRLNDSLRRGGSGDPSKPGVALFSAARTGSFEKGTEASQVELSDRGRVQRTALVAVADHACLDVRLSSNRG